MNVIDDIRERLMKIPVHAKRISEGSPIGRDYYEVSDVVATIDAAEREADSHHKHRMSGDADQTS